MREDISEKSHQARSIGKTNRGRYGLDGLGSGQINTTFEDAGLKLFSNIMKRLAKVENQLVSVPESGLQMKKYVILAWMKCTKN